MASHYFHSTNGEDVIFDHRGLDLDRLEDLHATAEAIAARLMRSVPGYRDWAGWIVCVYDGEGRCIDEVPFPHQTRAAPASPQRRNPAKRPALAAA